MIRLSEPIFTQDKNKAIIHYYYARPKGGGTFGINVFRRENDIWVKKGGHPIGIGH
jgi:hypothetical protein